MLAFAIGAAVVALLVVVVTIHRRSLQRTRKNGLTAEATIVRMEGGGEGSAPNFRLTLEWTEPSGRKRTWTVQKTCALANLPQQGDKVRIYYTDAQPATGKAGVLTFATNNPLRRDELEHLAPERRENL